MKPEFAEKLFIESLFQESVKKKKVSGSFDELEKLAGDASTRRYYRITTQDGPYVVCLDNPLSHESKKNEFLVVQEVLEGLSIRVPKIYDYDLKKGYILEEDLGDKTLLKVLGGNSDKDFYEKEISKSLNLLIKMHSINVQEYSHCSFAKMAFDYNKLNQEVEFTHQYFIKEFLGHELSDKQLKHLKNQFDFLLGILTKEKRVFTHRDFHTRNLMMKDKKQVVIDFQDARLGIPQYDLVSLLEDSYFKIEDHLKEDLKESYFKEFLKKNHYQESHEEFLYLYDLMAVQRIYKAIGSFCFIYKTRGDIRYLKYIGHAFENLKLVLDKHSGLKKLRSTLGEIYYAY